MCGIVGYTGGEQAAPILLDGLSKLEYRGYDSAGIAVRNSEGKNEIVKTKGRLHVLSDMIDGGKSVAGTCGIGHTRWATHGAPSDKNAHPHHNSDSSIVVVHNGIIENYLELKDKLDNKGYTFYSETDTEIATKIIDYYYKKWKDPLQAMVSFTLRVRGSYAVAVMFDEYPDDIFVARKDSPLIVGVSEDASYCASDVRAILKYTRNIYYLDNMEIARVERGKATFYNVDSKIIKKEPKKIDWDEEAAEKGEFEHFMIKEIREQPAAVRNTLADYIVNGKVDMSRAGLSDEELADVRRVQIAACGSAYHVGVVAKYVIEELARIPVSVDVASEFRYRNPIYAEGDLLVVISQSGETADTLAALRQAKDNGIKTLAIVNVLDSVIAREADKVLYTKAGPEISVATTKAYSSQLVAIYLLAVQLAKTHSKIDDKRYAQLISDLQKLPAGIEKLVSGEDRIKWYATRIANRNDLFFIGRGIDYAICQEGSLKLKEISYIHSEAYAAGELKHGTISLIEEGTPVIAVLTQMQLSEKTVSNIEEVETRGGSVMCVTLRGNYSLAKKKKDIVNIEDGDKNTRFIIYVPKTDPLFTASYAVIPLQLLSYYVSVCKGTDIDMPRNLAKCVSVE
ncbi:MAG: glutamine--fructose-6-phosphate transaminase (isomerizing) [Clostridia bacterium]|nr:glutamine--fructose-6-phosphate transaminase (isomerizing) [Clostridia bacterium]